MSGTNSFGVCRGCGERVVWVRMKSGKNMPCNCTIVNYRKDNWGNERIVTQDGDVVTGTTGVAPDQADGMGYISHFATCASVGNFRRRSAER